LGVNKEGTDWNNTNSCPIPSLSKL